MEALLRHCFCLSVAQDTMPYFWSQACSRLIDLVSKFTQLFKRCLAGKHLWFKKAKLHEKNRNPGDAKRMLHISEDLEMTGKVFCSILAPRLLWHILYRPFKHTYTAQKHVYRSWKDTLDNLLLTLAFPQKGYTTGTVTALQIISLFTLLDGPHTQRTPVITHVTIRKQA